MKVTYIHHSSFLVELEQVQMLFDYIGGSLDCLNLDKELVVFSSHRHQDHFSEKIFESPITDCLVTYVLSSDIWKKRVPEAWIGKTSFMELEDQKMMACGKGVTVTTTFSTDIGVAFMVETEGKTIYHAGDLNNWHWAGESEEWNRKMGEKYTRALETLKGFSPDVAFVPVDGRLEEGFSLGIKEYASVVGASYYFPMHCWGDYSLIEKLKQDPEVQGYQKRIMDITEEGQRFSLDI